MSDMNLNTAGPVADPSQYQSTQDRAAELKKGNHVIGTPTALGVGAAAGVGSPSDAVDLQLKVKTTAPGAPNTDAPSLPNPTGKSASPGVVIRVVKNPLASMGTGLYAALQVMTKIAAQNIKLGIQIKAQQGAAEVGAKQDELAHKEDEIAGSRASSVTKLIGGIAGSAASGALGYAGARSEIAHDASQGRPAGAESAGGGINVSRTAGAAGSESGTGSAMDISRKSTTQHKQADIDNVQTSAGEQSRISSTVGETDKHVGDRKADVRAGKEAQEAGERAASSTVSGSVYRAVSQSAAGTVSSMFDVVDKTMGGQRDADDAAIDQKADAVEGQIAHNNAETASGALDEAKEKRKNAQAAIQAHVQLTADAGSKASSF